MSPAAETLAANVLVGALALLSLVLVFFAGRAWWYARGARTLALFAAFVLFAVKALVLLGGLFLLPDWKGLLMTSVAFDLAILLGFYLASLR